MASFFAALLTSIVHFFFIPIDNREDAYSQIEAPPAPSPSPSPSPCPSPSPSEPGSSSSSPPQRQMSSVSLNVAPPHPTTNLANGEPHEPHRTALECCLEYNDILAQVGALFSSIAANSRFAEKYPKIAFVMGRVGKAIALISAIIDVMPTIPLYVSLSIAAAMILVDAHQYFSSSS